MSDKDERISQIANRIRMAAFNLGLDWQSDKEGASERRKKYTAECDELLSELQALVYLRQDQRKC